MTMLPVDPDELVALGAFAGAQVLVVCFSVIIANVYRERALLLHGAATMMGVLAVQTVVGGHSLLAEAILLMVLAVDGLQLRELVKHAGALRQPRRWLMAISLGLLPALALAGYVAGWHLLLPGLAAWSAVVMVIMLRAWPQGRPWAGWLVPGQLALVAGVGWQGWHAIDKASDPVLPLAALLSVWSATVFLATAWRNRIFGETRLRMDARNTIDPLTGLSTPLIFYDRVGAVRNLIKRYGHPSVLLLAHIENLDRLSAEFGPEVAESALLVAANRIRQTLRDGDVAARLSHSRIAVLAEGMTLAEGSANLASRILVAGLKEPLPAALTEFLHFRIVLTAIPVNDMPAKTLLQRLSMKLDQQLLTPSDRRILTLTAEDLLA
ncbi:diguanylate cyclase domain-containing protein [Caenimonas soli]|uniref:diguanylate cyclase domain-containing protein n=1 Tax=Caenimonas soli TaxID=2735555 RepID=UPI0015566618|nr:diguanylate cyclase [Caenimonas soli]NPC55661.1 diguanylate cyclase [Caenimonas soli]